MAATTGRNESKQLSPATCDRLLTSRTSLFHRMWAIQPRQQRKPGELACWDVRRDDFMQRQTSGTFFDDVETGKHCTTTDWCAA